MNQLDRLPEEWIERIFMRLHGRFGNTFFNKFKTGELNKNAEDAGIVNMKATWAYELRGVNSTRIKAGLDASYDRAPDCDLFKSKCVLQAEIQDYKALHKSLSEEDIERNKERMDKIQKDFQANKDRTDYKKWARDLVSGEVASNWFGAIDKAKEALAA